MDKHISVSVLVHGRDNPASSLSNLILCWGQVDTANKRQKRLGGEHLSTENSLKLERYRWMLIRQLPRNIKELYSAVSDHPAHATAYKG